LFAMERPKTLSKGFSGFDLERWKRRTNRGPLRMCQTGSLRSSDDEEPEMWSSDEEHEEYSTRTACK